ncbi:MAG TPA: hypothetical protein VF493_09500, partial [Terriglobales bacterium]
EIEIGMALGRAFRPPVLIIILLAPRLTLKIQQAAEEPPSNFLPGADSAKQNKSPARRQGS